MGRVKANEEKKDMADPCLTDNGFIDDQRVWHVLCRSRAVLENWE